MSHNPYYAQKAEQCRTNIQALREAGRILNGANNAFRERGQEVIKKLDFTIRNPHRRWEGKGAEQFREEWGTIPPLYDDAIWKTNRLITHVNSLVDQQTEEMRAAQKAAEE